MSRKGTVDVFQNKITRNDRFAQMSRQEMVIEQKKREIQAKIEQKQKGTAAATATTPTPINAPDIKTPKVVIPSVSSFNFNTFSNDGSFLDQFKQLKEKKQESRHKTIFKKTNSKGYDRLKKSTEVKVNCPGKKDSKTRASRFNERSAFQFDNNISISKSYKNKFDSPQSLITNVATISPQSVTGQPLLKNNPIATNNIGIPNALSNLTDINLMTTLQQSQVNINQVISTINEINMGINKNINVMSNIVTAPLLLNMPPPSVNVLISISEPPPVITQTTLSNLVNLTVNLTPNQNIIPEQLNVLVPKPPPLPLNITQNLPLATSHSRMSPPILTAIPTLELSSIPPPNPIQIHNIPQPEPLNTLSIPPPAPLQVRNIPPPSPLQLTEIPNPKPLDLMNIPTPTDGLPPTDFITSIPPPNKSIPPPNAGMSETSGTMNVNVSVPPPCTTTTSVATDVMLCRLPPNINIPPPMAQPPPTIHQQVMLPPPPPPLQNVQQQQQVQVKLVASIPPPIQPAHITSVLPIPIPTPPIPALMAHPILPPPPPQTTTTCSITASLLIQQQQQQTANVAAMNTLRNMATMAPAAPPPPLNMTCPPPALLVELARMEKTHQLQQNDSQSEVIGVNPPFVRNNNAVFTAGSVEFEVMAQMARVVARCGNSVQEVLLQRKPRDPGLWFIHEPYDSPIYRQYQQLVDHFRCELTNEVITISAPIGESSLQADGNESNAVEDYRPEDIYDPDEAIVDEDDCGAALGIGGPGFGSSASSGSEAGDGTNTASTATETAEERRKRKRKSRWGDEGCSALRSITTQPPPSLANVPSASTANQAQSSNPMLKLSRSDPALLQYAQQTFGSIQLSEDDWKKAEDHYKINLLYQDMLRKRQEVERLQRAGKFKYDYDSDEEVDEIGPGTWEHKLREKEMMATNLWAAELTKQAAGKHHIGDFLPPEEYKKFMEKSQAAKEGRTPDISDYKEFKLKEDNVGFKMLQKLGWSEGQGLGADGSGIVEPVNKGAQRDMNHGLGVGEDNLVANDDDEYDSYRKRMMLAYRFRPNPLNNPRRPYY